MRGVLVTGGAGFIGSHVVAALRAAGRAVVVLDDFSAGRRENLAEWTDDPEVAIVEADVRRDLDAALAGRGPFAAVIHLAAQTSVIRSVAAPLDDLDTNLRATASLALWAARAGIPRLVFASSAAVYGDAAAPPIDEDAPTRPLSPYGAGKRAAELYLGCLGPLVGLSTACLRLFNVYGPRQDPQSPYAGVVAAFLERALAREPLVVHGDGAQTRDLVYVGDVARALVAAAGVGWDLLAGAGPTGQVVCNIGTGREVPVAALAELAVAAARACGRDGAVIVRSAARPGEIARSAAATGRATRLGFVAEAELAEGLRRTAAWLLEQRG